MTRTFRKVALSAAVLAGVSASVACGGGNDGANFAVLPATTKPPATQKSFGQQPALPKVAVEDVAAGTYAVSLGDANTPTIGKDLAAAEGSRLLVLADSNDHANQLYRRAASSETWVAVPGSASDVSVTLLRSGPLAVAHRAGRLPPWRATTSRRLPPR